MPNDTVGQYTLVQRLHGEVSALTRATAFPQSDDAMTARVDALFTVSTRLSQAPSLTAADLYLKLSVLCHRLRDQLDPDDRGGVLTYLLAEAVRDDHLLLAHAPVGEAAIC